MLKALVWSVALLTASTAVAEQVARPPAPKPAPAPKVTLVMTAATLADDCGGMAPIGAPAPVPAPAPPPAPITASKSDAPAPKAVLKADSEIDDETRAKGARAKAERRCEQTSMQLAVTTSAASGTTPIVVKKVELFDETGKSLGVLTAAKPRVWNTTKGMYETWNQSVGPSQSLNVSYALSQPAWGPPVGRRDKTYTLKATVTVGKTTETLSRDVHIAAPTILPPGVKT